MLKIRILKMLIMSLFFVFTFLTWTDKGACTSRKYIRKHKLNLPKKYRLTDELTGIKRVIQELQASKFIKEEQMVSLRQSLLKYASSLKRLFEATIKEVEKGHPQALVEFESLAKSHEKEFKKMLSQAQNLEEKIKRGEILPHEQWLKRMTPEQRKNFLKILAPEGQKAIKRTFPNLFSKKIGFLSSFWGLLSVNSAEAKIVEPCLDICEVTQEEIFSFAKEDLERFWEEASEECKQCVRDNNILFNFMVAWENFNSCTLKAQSLEKIRPILGYLHYLTCVYALIGTAA